jgi:hypothetical protein
MTKFQRLLLSCSFLNCLKVARLKMTGRNYVSIHHSLLVMTMSALRKYREILINLNNRLRHFSVPGSSQIALPSFKLLQLRGLLKFVQQMEIFHIL